MAELNDNLKSCIYRGNSNHGGATNGFHDGGAAASSLTQQNQSHFQNLGRLASIVNRNKKFPALSDKVEVFQARPINCFLKKFSIIHEVPEIYLDRKKIHSLFFAFKVM